MSAIELLEKAAGHLKDRAATYDKPEGERSIGAAVAAFNAVTGDGLMNTGERGWLFMAILKMVRSQQGNYKADNYEDLAAYGALMGEAACDERNGGWTDREIKAAAFKDACEYTLEEVIGDAVLSDWARWVAVDASGEVREHGAEPYVDDDYMEWLNPKGRLERINKVVPPLNFKNCIWEVNK